MGGRKTVLVVDDDDSLRLLCRVNLELEGYRVLDAATVAEAREHLSKEPVHAALVDVHVGSDNGLELVRELREHNPDIGVALFTGSADLTSASRRLADAVLPKPFRLDELTSLVAKLTGVPEAHIHF
jgi:DNA-binding NtrC family response regulator